MLPVHPLNTSPYIQREVERLKKEGRWPKK